jgi:hypothetical protein
MKTVTGMGFGAADVLPQALASSVANIQTSVPGSLVANLGRQVLETLQPGLRDLRELLTGAFIDSLGEAYDRGFVLTSQNKSAIYQLVNVTSEEYKRAIEKAATETPETLSKILVQAFQGETERLMKIEKVTYAEAFMDEQEIALLKQRIDEVRRILTGFVAEGETDARVLRPWQEELSRLLQLIDRGAFKEMSEMTLPNWDKWMSIDLDAQADMIHNFWDTYRSDAEYAISGVNMMTREQYQLYIKYTKDLEKIDSIYLTWQETVAAEQARYIEEIARLKGLKTTEATEKAKALEAELLAFMDNSAVQQARVEQDLAVARLAIRSKNLKDIEAEEIKAARKRAQRAKGGDSEKWAEQAELLITKGVRAGSGGVGFGDVATGVGMEAIAGTEVGKMLAGGDPISIMLAALAEFAMSIENVSKILNPFATMFEAMRTILEPLINGILKPLVDILEMFSEIVATLLSPFLAMTQLAMSIGYVVAVLSPFFIIIQLLSKVFEGLTNIINWVGNKIIDVLNAMIRGVNSFLGINIRLLDRLGEADSAADQLAATLRRKSELLGNTLQWLSNMLKKEAAKQQKSLQDLWEVGAISTTEYETKVADINSKMLMMEEERLQIDTAQLATLDSMLELWQNTSVAKELVDTGIDVSLAAIPGVLTTVSGEIATVGTNIEKLVASNELFAGHFAEYAEKKGIDLTPLPTPLPTPPSTPPSTTTPAPSTTSTGGGGTGIAAATAIGSTVAGLPGAIAGAVIGTLLADVERLQKEGKEHVAAKAQADANVAALKESGTWKNGWNLAQRGIELAKGAAAWLAAAATRVAIKAKGGTPEFAQGAVNIPQDMNANIHKGEGIIPSDFMSSVRKGDISIAGPSGGRQSSENSVQVNVYVQGSVTAERDLAKSIAKEIYVQKKRGTLGV